MKTKRMILNRDVIKYIAIFTMFLNHFASIFFEKGTVIYEVLVDIGYFTSITMCYFLVEGYRYTGSKKKYAMRLFVFAIVSQLPYLIAFKQLQFNMIFTLFFCLCFIWVGDSNLNYWIKYVARLVLVVFCCFSDWNLFALLFVWEFHKHYGNQDGIKHAYAISTAANFILNYIDFIGDYSVLKSIFLALGSSVGLVISAAVIILLYNGKKSDKNSRFSKWFFYWFYPVHIILLLLLKSLISQTSYI